jgi:hypothetical protein
VAVCHIPPAFSQSARLVYFAKSAAPLPDGLAEGDEDEPLEPDGLGVLMVPPEELPELPEPVVPEGLVEPDPLLPGLV